MTGRSDELPSIPEAIRARLAHPTVRLSGPVGHLMVASFFDQLRPVLEVDGSILIELDHGLRFEEQGFAELVDGANADGGEIARRPYGGWYLSAEEALNRGLVAGLV